MTAIMLVVILLLLRKICVLQRRGNHKLTVNEMYLKCAHAGLGIAHNQFYDTVHCLRIAGYDVRKK